MTNSDKFFTYDALKLLYNDLDNLLSYFKIDEITIVPFKINFNCNYPFNTFLLVNDLSKNCLQFPYLNVGYANECSEYLLSTMNCYLYSLLFATNKSNILKYDLDSFIDNIEFKGIYVYENKMYAFIDLTKVEIDNSLINRDSSYWFALVDEIVNKKQICNISISEDTTKFFLNNNDFIFFKNSKGEQIEVPIVAYTGTHEKNLRFRFIFGNIPYDNNAIVSSGYYFTNYITAIRDGGWSIDYKPEYKYGQLLTEGNENDTTGKYIKCGIIRHALFLGKNLIKMNYPNDDIDESEIKKEKMTNIDVDKNAVQYMYEKMTLRISDHDGLWKQKFDSVYLGKIELDDGSYLKNTPIYVVKDYYNHTPVSYHFIDKTTLGITFDENSDYKII
jgi:hypothetical protein